MQTTTNYNYNLVESTDTANIPVQISPNFTAIDSDLKDVSDAALTVAIDTYASNTHALVRNDSDRNVFYFVAPSNYVAGDTFTLDGVVINAVSVSGEALTDNAFRVNSIVPCYVFGQTLTLVVDKAVTVPTPTAASTSYDNTTSGLSATNVQDAIDEVKADIPTSFNANNISYNNTVSGLQANNVQSALDEIAQLISTPGINYIFTTNGSAQTATLSKDGIIVGNLSLSANTYTDALISIRAANTLWRISTNVNVTVDGVPITANTEIFTIAYSTSTSYSAIIKAS